MKIIAAIQARMGSTRFPGKVMANLWGKRVLQWVIEKAKRLHVDNVVLLTSLTTENIPLQRLAQKLRIDIMDSNYRNINFNDLQCFIWYYCAGIDYGADYIIRICGDSPFIDVDLANIMIDRVHPEYDYFSYQIDGKPAIQTLYGIFVEIFSVQKIKAIMEHVTVPFYTDFNQSLISWYMPHKYKLSIDYPEDLELAKKVIEFNHGKMPGYKEINRIMKAHPELQYHGNGVQKYEWNTP